MEDGRFTFAVDRPNTRGYWSDERLTEREQHLTEHIKAAGLDGERLEQVHRELGHIAFEKWHRRDEKKQREEEITWLEHEARLDIDDCPTTEWPVIELDDGEAA